MADKEVTTKFILQGDSGGMVAATERGRSGLRDMDTQARNTAGSVDLLSMAGSRLGTVLGGIGITATVSQLLEAGMASERFRNSFEAAAGSVHKGAAEYAYARAEAQRLGLDLRNTADAYLKLTASSKGTTMEGEKTQKVFSAVAGATRTLGLSADQQSGALMAIQQMMSKGTVQAEELRGQLGERLPGAVQIAARAMGVSTAELGKMLEKGEVIADEFLPRFAAELEKTFPASEKAMHGLTAETERLKTAWFELKATVMDSGGEGMFASSARGMTWLANEAERLFRTMTKLDNSRKSAPAGALSGYEQYVTGVSPDKDFTLTPNVLTPNLENRYAGQLRQSPDVTENFGASLNRDNAMTAKEAALFGKAAKHLKAKKDDRAWGSADEKYLDYLKAFNARQVAETKSGMVAMLYENEQGYKTGLVSLQEYLEKKQTAVTDEMNAERIAALKNLDERQQDLVAKSKVAAAKTDDAAAAGDYHAALKMVEEADTALINIESKLHIQRMKDSVEYRDAVNNEGLSNASSLSRWAAAREKIADDERKAEFDHRNSLVQMAADASEKRLSFLGQEDAALVLHHDTERAQILAQTQWKLDNLIMEESEKRRLNEETAAQLLALDQKAAEQRAQLWWNNSQQYLGFAQSMTTMAVQMMLFEEGQKGQIGKRMLATSIRFIAQGLQQYMFGKAKEHMLAAAAAAGQIQTRTGQAAAEMAIGATMASAWAAFYTAMSLNPYGGQAFIPAATATAASAVGFGVAAGAIAAEGAASMAAELGMAAAWAAGGLMAGALGEAGASSIEGGTSGSTSPAGYGAGSYGSPVVTQPLQQNTQPTMNITMILNNAIGERKWFEDNVPEMMKDFKSRGINIGVEYSKG